MAEPLIDVIMLVHSQATWADLAIRAVEHHTKTPYRLILVNQNSPNPKMHDVLKAAEARGHTVIHLPENKSFSNGNNAGVGVGNAKFICILNDDAIVTEGWETHLLQDCSEKSVGLSGARSNYAGGVQSDMGFQGEPPFLVFLCVMLRREVWNAVGPLDEENFTGFSSEDLDYSWRVKKAGYRLKLSNAYVLHAGSRSIAATVAADAIKRQDGAGIVAALQAHNDKYGRVLVEKWGKDFVAENSRIRERVLVTCYHAEEWTRVDFMKSLILLRTEGKIPFELLTVQRAPIHMARQLAADYALQQGFDWFVQFDDDATFPPDVLSRLLKHQKDVVTALAYQRKPPYRSCIFEVPESGVLGSPLDNWERTGLRKVDVSGFHVSATRTRVFRKLREAGITQYFGGFDNKVGEDFAACLNFKKVGVQVYCDTDLIAGHIGSSIIVDENYRRLYKEGRAP